MESAQSSQPQQGKQSRQFSSIENLRTVEFRQTLRGYHIDDVDEYLERVAVEAEALQEQLRQAGARLRQAGERIAALERQAESAGKAEVTEAPSTDDTLQRTLLMAQRFVDQVKSEAEENARATLAEAEERASRMTEEAEQRAKALVAEAEQGVREEVHRLETTRGELMAQVETMARQLEGERSRLRGDLGKLIQWVDERLQPAQSLLVNAPEPATGGEAAQPGGAGPSGATGSSAVSPQHHVGEIRREGTPNGVQPALVS